MYTVYIYIYVYVCVWQCMDQTRGPLKKCALCACPVAARSMFPSNVFTASSWERWRSRRWTIGKPNKYGTEMHWNPFFSGFSSSDWSIVAMAVVFIFFYHVSVHQVRNLSRLHLYRNSCCFWTASRGVVVLVSMFSSILEIWYNTAWNKIIITSQDLICNQDSVQMSGSTVCSTFVSSVWSMTSGDSSHFFVEVH